MFCLDDYDIDIYGNEQSDEFAFVDLILMPCNVKLSALYEGEDDRIGPECVNDLD